MMNHPLGGTAVTSVVVVNAAMITAVTARMACPVGNERFLNAPFTQHCKIICYIRLLGI